MHPTGEDISGLSTGPLSRNPFGIAGDRAGISGPNDACGAGEYSWGSGLTPFPNDPPSQGGMYRATSPEQPENVRVSQDMRI